MSSGLETPILKLFNNNYFNSDFDYIIEDILRVGNTKTEITEIYVCEALPVAVLLSSVIIILSNIRNWVNLVLLDVYLIWHH